MPQNPANSPLKPERMTRNELREVIADVIYGHARIPAAVPGEIDLLMGAVDKHVALRLNEAVSALQQKAQTLSSEAEEEMRRDLEERAQEWHDAAELVRRLTHKKPATEV